MGGPTRLRSYSSFLFFFKENFFWSSQTHSAERQR